MEKAIVTKNQAMTFGLIMILIMAIVITIIRWQAGVDKKDELSRAEERSKREQSHLTNLYEQSKAQRDSIQYSVNGTKDEVITLSGEVKAYRKEDQINERSYQKSLNNYKNIQNEKEYVPISSTTEQQLDFLSKFKYEPF